ncbi:hypothetical protein [Aeoliella sp.]|uniref:hypothetical protein n=1 Tax=Aeoliella sp. TaxID=2795800 RepID=UPI003CCB9E4B
MKHGWLVFEVSSRGLVAVSVALRLVVSLLLDRRSEFARDPDVNVGAKWCE